MGTSVCLQCFCVSGGFFGPSWERLRGVLGGLGEVLGRSLGGLGGSRGVSGGILAHLEASWGPLGVIVGPLGGFWEASSGFLGPSWDLLAENVEKLNTFHYF